MDRLLIHLVTEVNEITKEQISCGCEASVEPKAYGKFLNQESVRASNVLWKFFLSPYFSDR